MIFWVKKKIKKRNTLKIMRLKRENNKMALQVQHKMKLKTKQTKRYKTGFSCRKK